MGGINLSEGNKTGKKLLRQPAAHKSERRGQKGEGEAISKRGKLKNSGLRGPENRKKEKIQSGKGLKRGTTKSQDKNRAQGREVKQLEGYGAQKGQQKKDQKSREEKRKRKQFTKTKGKGEPNGLKQTR